MANRVRRLVGPVVFAALLAADVWFNGLLGGAPGETLSERLGRARDRGSVVALLACIPLELIEADHCRRVVAP